MITLQHYIKLTYRGLLLICAVMVWILNPQLHDMNFSTGFSEYNQLFIVIWIVFAIEMVARFFPTHTESMGCQKQFIKNYKKTDAPDVDRKELNRGVPTVIISWLLLNGVIALLYKLQLFSDGVLLLIALAYSVCDMICILFFCPFQIWMMKNRCCTSCRIYNWDYLMMFTPLILIPSLYTWGLAALAVGLFIRWEITFHRHPEYFSDRTNAALRCANCQEKLCQHKRQLHEFWKKEEILIQNKANELIKKK